MTRKSLNTNMCNGIPFMALSKSMAGSLSLATWSIMLTSLPSVCSVSLEAEAEAEAEAAASGAGLRKHRKGEVRFISPLL